MAQEYQLVDPFVSLPEPPQGEHRQLDPNIARWFRHSKALLAGATIDDMIADMDEVKRRYLRENTLEVFKLG